MRCGGVCRRGAVIIRAWATSLTRRRELRFGLRSVWRRNTPNRVARDGAFGRPRRSLQGMTGKPEVSVVMSVYNGASDLAVTVDSILVQEGVGFELIVVNDG